jgi:hypothetical protein
MVRKTAGFTVERAEEIRVAQHFPDQQIDFDDPSTLTGRRASDVEAAIPKGWLTAPARSRLGRRYVDPNHLETRSG